MERHSASPLETMRAVQLEKRRWDESVAAASAAKVLELDTKAPGRPKRALIRISASLQLASGAEILLHDSLPFARPQMRKRLKEALTFLCDPGGYTIADGKCSVVLRIEAVHRSVTTGQGRDAG
jgi:hypothetical protein